MNSKTGSSRCAVRIVIVDLAGNAPQIKNLQKVDPLWNCAGGRDNGGESPAQVLIREAGEELGEEMRVSVAAAFEDERVFVFKKIDKGNHELRIDVVVLHHLPAIPEEIVREDDNEYIVTRVTPFAEALAGDDFHWTLRAFGQELLDFVAECQDIVRERTLQEIAAAFAAMNAEGTSGESDLEQQTA